MALLNRSCSVGFIYESSVVAGCHEHLDTDDVQDPELVRLQPSAELAWFFRPGLIQRCCGKRRSLGAEGVSKPTAMRPFSLSDPQGLVLPALKADDRVHGEPAETGWA